MHAEVAKIDDFYRQQEDAAIVQMNKLTEQCRLYQHMVSTGSDDKMARSKLKDALLEGYRQLELIKNYRILNYTAFVKIIKKYDKTFNQKSDFVKQEVDGLYIQQSKVIEQLLRECEQLYLNLYPENKHRDAKSKLRLPDLQKRTHHAVTWRVGFYVGLSIPALVSSIHALSGEELGDRLKDLIQIYSAFSIPIIFMFLFAVNLYVWQTASINYRFIFEFDPRDNMNYHEFTELASICLLVWSYSVYMTFANPFNSQFDGLKVFPVLYFCLVAGAVLQPFHFFYWTSRRWVLQTMYRMISAPRFPVEFRDFFLADELTSMVYVLSGIQLFICAYATNFQDTNRKCKISSFAFSPLINMLPAQFRLLQCFRRYYDTKLKFPHLTNAGKYCFSIATAWTSTIYNIYPSGGTFALWIITSIIATIYAYSWDIKMDWGLLQKNSKHKFLRDELVYSRKWVYYFAMASNFVLRITWMFVVSVGVWGQSIDIRTSLYALAILEVVRRFQWNFFRLENEHLNNCGQFRAVKEVPLPFDIGNNDQSDAEILEMGSMTETDRRKYQKELGGRAFKVQRNVHQQDYSKKQDQAEDEPYVPIRGHSREDSDGELLISHKNNAVSADSVNSVRSEED